MTTYFWELFAMAGMWVLFTFGLAAWAIERLERWRAAEDDAQERV